MRADTLGKEARRILGDLGVRTLLKQISEPELVGSASFGLMYLRDIDVHAFVETYEIKKIAQLLPQLAVLPTIQKVQFNNFRELRRDHLPIHAHFPHGYYIGLRTVQPSGEWKIDVWFTKRGEIDEYGGSQLQRLSAEQRGTILVLKERWATGSDYRDDAVGVDFYRAVLEHGVRSPQDFEQYLRERQSD